MGAGDPGAAQAQYRERGKDLATNSNIFCSSQVKIDCFSMTNLHSDKEKKDDYTQ